MDRVAVGQGSNQFRVRADDIAFCAVLRPVVRHFDGLEGGIARLVADTDQQVLNPRRVIGGRSSDDAQGRSGSMLSDSRGVNRHDPIRLFATPRIPERDATRRRPVLPSGPGA